MNTDYKAKIALIKNSVKKYQKLLKTAVEQGNYGRAANHAGHISGLESALMYLGEYDWSDDEAEQETQ